MEKFEYWKPSDWANDFMLHFRITYDEKDVYYDLVDEYQITFYYPDSADVLAVGILTISPDDGTHAQCSILDVYGNETGAELDYDIKDVYGIAEWCIEILEQRHRDGRIVL